MAQPVNRQEFKEYCLRKLGKPVIEINVDDDQVEDRIDEAISFWRDYHYDGSELVYYKHQLTADDLANGYIPIPPEIIGVVRIFDIGGMYAGISGGIFSAQYQYILNNISTLNSGGISDYFNMRTNLNLIEEVFTGKPIVRFNRHSNKLFLDVSSSKLEVGNYLIVESYGTIETPDVWSDRWLQNYATCLIKENWGSNVTKYQNMQLVGGMSFNGEKILDDAREERRKLENEVIIGFSPLIRNFYG